jgi:hypothetical protein
MTAAHSSSSVLPDQPSHGHNSGVADARMKRIIVLLQSAEDYYPLLLFFCVPVGPSLQHTRLSRRSSSRSFASLSQGDCVQVRCSGRGNASLSLVGHVVQTNHARHFIGKRLRSNESTICSLMRTKTDLKLDGIPFSTPHRTQATMWIELKSCIHCSVLLVDS